jgi:uncharacterized protein YbjQ (UPF0145 family)
MRIFTLTTVDENKYKPLGLVRGTIVHSVSFFRDILGNITGLLGGRNSAINKKIDDVYAEAITELEAYTKKTYPTATSIAGVEISLTEMREFIICVATGTAMVEITNKPNPTQNQVLKSAPMPRMIAAASGGKKRRTKRASHKSRKSRKYRK